MFAVEEDRNLKLLTWGLVPKHLAPVYGKAPNYLADPSTSSGAYSGLNPHAPRHHDITRVPDQGDHLPAFGWDSELIFIKSIS
jgi:hypothetical protein